MKIKNEKKNTSEEKRGNNNKFWNMRKIYRRIMVNHKTIKNIYKLYKSFKTHDTLFIGGKFKILLYFVNILIYFVIFEDVHYCI